MATLMEQISGQLMRSPGLTDPEITNSIRGASAHRICSTRPQIMNNRPHPALTSQGLPAPR